MDVPFPHSAFISHLDWKGWAILDVNVDVLELAYDEQRGHPSDFRPLAKRVVRDENSESALWVLYINRPGKSARTSRKLCITFKQIGLKRRPNTTTRPNGIMERKPLQDRLATRD